MINYIKVKLKTDPNTEFTVPQEYDARAKDLIGSIMDLSSTELREKIHEIVAKHEYLGNPGIMQATSNMIKNKDTPSAQMCMDELYLRIAQKGNEKYLRSPEGAENPQAWNVDRELIDGIEKLHRILYAD